MTLANRIKRLEAQRWGWRLEDAGVAFEHDAKGEPIGAMVTRWDGVRFPLSRSPGETVGAFLIRIGAAAGDLASAQAYVIAELRREYEEA
jgi:sulfite reductase beta subunit-like hemoprotein